MSVAGRRTPGAAADVVDAAFAVVSVSVALGRLVAGSGAWASRRALSRLPAPGDLAAVAGHPLPAARRVLSRRLGPVVDALLPQLVAAVLARLDVAGLVHKYVDVDRIGADLDVDAVAARLDVARIVERIDVDAVAAALDLDALVEKVDVMRVIDRVDLDAVVDRVDIDRAAARLDLDRVIDRVDLDAVAARIDVEAIAAGLDLNALAEKIDVMRVIDRVDLDTVVGRVDIDRAAARLDLDPVIDRADVVGLARYVMQEIDLPGVIRSSTSSLTTDMVRGVRDQGADADRAVERVVDRLLHRRGRHDDEPRESR
jgi:hypothetical protein